MAVFVMAVLSLSAIPVTVGGATPAVTQFSVYSEPACHDWGEGEGAARVLEGEAGWLDCPLFSHPTVYNYSSALAAGLNLVWYHTATGQDLEQPIDFHHPDQRLSKERERLWLQPAAAQDTGQYICMLRNRTSCAKIAVRLEVVAPTQNLCDMATATPPQQAVIPLQGGKTLSCPDLPSRSHTVTWYYKCKAYPFHDLDRQIQGNRLVVHVMLEFYQGPYFCVVTFESRGKNMTFTRMINVTAVSSVASPKEPFVLNPNKEQIFTVKQGSEVCLLCKVRLPYLEGPRETWWSIDGKPVDHLFAPRITSTSWMLSYDLGDVVMENELRIRDFSSEDLTREYNCSARNGRGFDTQRAVLVEEAYLPSVELGCGLGVALAVMLALFVVYHVYWLELLLLYRAWFGTDERCTDDKEYDIYISYARNSEEEQFVLLTLRRVLENELGYTVCIFDRDSLPGGTITDETLGFVGRSRRVLVVLSPGYALRGTQALLELRAGLDGMARGGHLRVILLQYQPLGRGGWVRELRRARVALALVRWRGDRSRDLSSDFWKRLRVELPVRRVRDAQQRDSSRLIPPRDTDTHRHSSHNLSEAILRCMQASRRLLLVLSPDYLTEKSVGLTECRLGLYLQHTSGLHVVTVLYQPIPAPPRPEALQLRRLSAAAITWRGPRSEAPGSRFWKRLRLALPVRPLGLGRRLIDSTSSHSDLAGLALQRRGTTNATTRRQESQAGARGRGRQRRRGQEHVRGERSKCGEGRSRTCGVCVGVRDPNGVLCKATVKTKLQQPLANTGASSCTAYCIDTASYIDNNINTANSIDTAGYIDNSNLDTANSMDTAKRRKITNGNDTAKSTEARPGLSPAPKQPQPTDHCSGI